MARRIGKRTRRLEVRLTEQERELINNAASSCGSDLTTFAVESLIESSRRVLADRDSFVLSEAQKIAWEEINSAWKTLTPRQPKSYSKVVNSS